MPKDFFSKVSRFANKWGAVLLILMIFTALDKPWAKVDLGKPESVTIYWDGQVVNLPSEHSSFGSLVSAAEFALGSAYGIYKGVTTADHLLTESGRVLVVKLPEQKNPKIVKILGGEIPVSQIAVPLAGRDYSKNRLVAAGSSTGLGEYKTMPWRLWYLKWLAYKIVRAN